MRKNQRLSGLLLAQLIWTLIQDESLETNQLVLRYLRVFSENLSKERNPHYQPATAQAIKEVLERSGFKSIHQHGMKFVAPSKNGLAGFWIVDASEEDYIHLYHRTQRGFWRANLNVLKDWPRMLKMEITVISKKAARQETI